MAGGVGAAEVFVFEGVGELVEDVEGDGVEACYGLVVEEDVEDGRREVGAEVCWVFDCVAGELLEEDVRTV